MLLIQSDMFKALWFMLYPIVTFSRGPIPNDSDFCQVNGFFLSLGIEASGTDIQLVLCGIDPNGLQTLPF
jgi:G protein-coupled receptor GPR1